jgi:hypothetical protein
VGRFRDVWGRGKGGGGLGEPPFLFLTYLTLKTMILAYKFDVFVYFLFVNYSVFTRNFVKKKKKKMKKKKKRAVSQYMRFFAYYMIIVHI